MIRLKDCALILVGEDLDETFELTDADTGGPLNQTGFTHTVECRFRYPSGGVAEAVWSSAEITFPDGAAGGFMRLRKPVAFSSSDRAGRYQIVITATDGTYTAKFVTVVPVVNDEQGVPRL
jgi:hypothetical protein